SSPILHHNYTLSEILPFMIAAVRRTARFYEPRLTLARPLYLLVKEACRGRSDGAIGPLWPVTFYAPICAATICAIKRSVIRKSQGATGPASLGGPAEPVLLHRILGLRASTPIS